MVEGEDGELLCGNGSPGQILAPHQSLIPQESSTNTSAVIL